MPRRDVQQGSACARACVHAHACEGGVGILGRVAREASPGRRHLSQDLKERREQAARWPAGRSTANGAGARAPRGHRARHVRHEGAGGTEGVGGWEGGRGGKGLRADAGSSAPKPLSLLTSLPLPDATAATEQSTRLLRGLVPFPSVLLAALRAWTADFQLGGCCADAGFYSDTE